MKISMEPRNMGGYVSFFLDNPTINIVERYDVRLYRYGTWAREIMFLVISKKIRLAYHPESGENEMKTGDKCYQPSYLNRILS